MPRRRQLVKCWREWDKVVYWSHEAALLKIVEIAFDPEREGRGQTVPNSTYICPREGLARHWHLTSRVNTEGWKPEHSH